MATVQISRADIQTRGDKVRLFDRDEETGLELYCYNRCENNDDVVVQNCRGVVFHGDNLVMKAFPYTQEYDCNYADLDKLLVPFEQWQFYPAHEGALLRMFYFGEKWFLSTHRKLNAFRSKWSSRDSFGVLFERALEQRGLTYQNFQNSLNKEYQYMFLLRNTKENRIVCRPPIDGEPLLYHVGTFVGGQLRMDVDCGLPQPERLRFGSVDEVRQYILNRVKPLETQGLIAFGPGNVQIKIVHPEYLELFQARGNVPSVKFRYLQVRMNKKLTKMMYDLYPDMAPVFEEYENNIYDIARMIHMAYIQRFVNKLPFGQRVEVRLPKPEYYVMMDCHSQYQADRKNNRISLERVIMTLNRQPAINLNTMIRRLRLEQQRRAGVHPRSYNNSVENSPAVGPQPAPLVI